MNEFFKNLIDRIKGVWAKWKTPQRIIFFSSIGAVLLAIILLVAFSAGPNMVPVLTSPIKDADALDRITQQLDVEGIKYQVSSDSRVLVGDEKTARKARGILIREDLIPKGTDPWALFDTSSWTTTDFERNVNLRRSLQQQLKQHIEAIGEVDSAEVVIVVPDKTLFSEDQDPVTASVALGIKPGSDFATNRKKIEGIEKLIQFAIPGLKRENIVITDKDSASILNDWTTVDATDKLDIKQRELKIKRQEEQKYMKAIRDTLTQVFGDGRVTILNVEVALNVGDTQIKKTEITPIIISPKDPTNPASEAVTTMSVAVSEAKFNEQYQGSGFTPEGPPGVEGQTPPAYKDLSGVVGNYSRQDNKTNYDYNHSEIQETPGPTIDRVSAAVAIDGSWKKVYDDKGVLQKNPDGSIKREYVPLTADQLGSAQKLVEAAMGFDKVRGDLIRVENIAFDHSKEFAQEDDAIRRAEQTQQIVLWSLVGLAVILLVFIAFRLISREIERRRRLREEELARQHQAMREAALRSAEEESSEVEMSVEERARLELQEHAVNLAREHPEDVAQLIRTWLMEE